jgi:hypothetical protein
MPVTVLRRSILPYKTVPMPNEEQTAVWNIVMFLEWSALLKHNLTISLLSVISHIVYVMHVLATVLQPLVCGFWICYQVVEESWRSCGVKTGKTRVKCSHLSVYCLRSPEVGIPKSRSLMTERTRQILYALRRYPLLPLSEKGQRLSLRIVVLLEWCILIRQWTVPCWNKRC